ncbi:DUF2269 domain-containing protein [Streptomyces armeniacus]|uniref:DUF2269 domain-containing protein n=1 Tax=Streptomyces armeniacus TaxID=83291 RepID=A0A345XY77_9ACTN|nr:DUF2269 domain-containing protein [Streptomyces armeniacus]AXK36593.1 DUF2269 domain-containing protein [Streptomyces armeniacus]
MTNSPRGQRRNQRFALSRPTRRAVLVVHVIVSVGWLGLTLCLLTLAIAGASGGDAATDAMAYRAMKTFGDWLLAPVALLTIVSGLVLSLGTHWGLARHRWVWIKFLMTMGLATATLFGLRTDLDHAAAQVAAGEQVDGVQLLYGPSVSLTAYVFITTISVLKPWGLTRRGKRHRAAEQEARRGGASRTPEGAGSGANRTGDGARSGASNRASGGAGGKAVAANVVDQAA